MTPYPYLCIEGVVTLQGGSQLTQIRLVDARESALLDQVIDCLNICTQLAGPTIYEGVSLAGWATRAHLSSQDFAFEFSFCAIATSNALSCRAMSTHHYHPFYHRPWKTTKGAVSRLQHQSCGRRRSHWIRLHAVGLELLGFGEKHWN